MIRIVLAGSTPAAREALAAELAERLALPSGDGFVLAHPPADLVAFDAELARGGADLDALVHLGGAPEALLDHYGRAVVEIDGSAEDLPERVLAGIREALVTG